MNTKFNFPDTEFERLLQLDKIERDDLAKLSREKQAEFKQFLIDRLNTLKGDERDAFVEKAKAIIDRDFIWELNQHKIAEVVSLYMEQFGCVPTKQQLSDATGLSRPTVRKHLRSFTERETQHEQNEIFALMTRPVLGKVLKSAMKGDMAAAKVFLQMANDMRVNQNNDLTLKRVNYYIQINNTVLTQQVVEQLKPDQLKQIEEIIKSVNV